MRLSLFILALAVSCASLPSALSRTSHDLGGPWKFSFEGDPAPSDVIVPHTWNARDGADGSDGAASALSVQGNSYKRGKGTYTREMELSPEKGKRYFLRFEGASIVADVEVNDRKAGRHEGAFGAFCFEVTDLLVPGKNRITVTVDNTFNRDILPLGGDFSMFGGLYRPLALIETDDICIKPDYFASPGVFVAQKELNEREGHIEVTTFLSARNSPAKKGVVSIQVKSPEGRVVARSEEKLDIAPGGEWKNVQKLVVKNPRLWQGRSSPALYQVVVSLKTEEGQSDEVKQPLGFRTVSIDPAKGFVLNGKPMQLKGVNRHQDREGKGWAVSARDEAQDMKYMLDMGVDALRTAHYPQTEHMYDLCDRNGLIVWTEVPAVEKVRDTIPFRENMKQQAMEMLLQHGNHPSICLWGIFNEIYHQCSAEDRKADMITVLKELNSCIKELDPGRMTVAATNQPGNKTLNTISDVLAQNMYPGWYGGGPKGMGGGLDSLARQYSDRGVGVSEYGHGASIYLHQSPCSQPVPVSYWHPEEWQAIGHEENYREIRKRPNIWGTFVWNMFDFASDARKEGERPGMNDKGLVTYDRKTPKDAYFFYKANWNPELMCYITSRRFTERNQAEVPVKVYSNADSVELKVNGKVVGTSLAPDELRRAVWEKVPLKKGKNNLEIKAVKGGKTVRDSCIWNYTGGSVAVDKYDALKNGATGARES